MNFLLIVALVALVPNVLALYEQCNHLIELNSGQKIYINSPYYPGLYPVGSSCRYTVQAPSDHKLTFKCSIDISSQPSSAHCTNNVFYFNREGSELLSGSDYFCGSGTLERKSFLNKAVISYISSSSSAAASEAGKVGERGRGNGGGYFSCLVEAVMESPCECGWSMSQKVAGTSIEAAINEFPSMAGVLSVKYNQVFCGAAIIHRRYLLSAAHCFRTAETNRSQDIRVVVGEHDLSTAFESYYTKVYDIEQIIVHENFRSTSTFVRNDIALLRTKVDFEWNRAVGPTCLPFPRSAGGGVGEKKPPSPGQKLVTAGWGTTSFGGAQSTRLLKTTLDVIPLEQCKSKIRLVAAGQFCTYTPGQDTCQYDSGGALYTRQKRLFAVGIVSYGFACASDRPSVNTRISSHLKWIKRKAKDAKFCAIYQRMRRLV